MQAHDDDSAYSDEENQQRRNSVDIFVDDDDEDDDDPGWQQHENMVVHARDSNIPILPAAVAVQQFCDRSTAFTIVCKGGNSVTFSIFQSNELPALFKTWFLFSTAATGEAAAVIPMKINLDTVPVNIVQRIVDFVVCHQFFPFQTVLPDTPFISYHVYHAQYHCSPSSDFSWMETLFSNSVDRKFFLDFQQDHELFSKIFFYNRHLFKSTALNLLLKTIIRLYKFKTVLLQIHAAAAAVVVRTNNDDDQNQRDLLCKEIMGNFYNAENYEREFFLQSRL